MTDLTSPVSLEVKTGKWSSSRKKVTLDAERNFTITDLKAGNHDLRLKDGDLVSDWVMNIPATTSGQAVPIVLTAYKGGSISGRVDNSETGLPLENMKFRLSSGDSTRDGYTRSDSEGKYSLRNIPAGDYELKVSLSYDSYSDSPTRKEVSLAPGQELTGINFKLNPGRILDERGKPVKTIFFKGILGKPGTTVKLTVKRKDSEKEKEISLTIGEWDYEKMYRLINK